MAMNSDKALIAIVVLFVMDMRGDDGGSIMMSLGKAPNLLRAEQTKRGPLAIVIWSSFQGEPDGVTYIHPPRPRRKEGRGKKRSDLLVWIICRPPENEELVYDLFFWVESLLVIPTFVCFIPHCGVTLPRIA